MNHETKRLSVRVGQTYALPKETRQVRILAGDAWVSLGQDDVVVHRHQTLHIHPGRQAIYITPLGKQQIEIVIATQAAGETTTPIH